MTLLLQNQILIKKSSPPANAQRLSFWPYLFSSVLPEHRLCRKLSKGTRGTSSWLPGSVKVPRMAKACRCNEGKDVETSNYPGSSGWPSFSLMSSWEGGRVVIERGKQAAWAQKPRQREPEAGRDKGQTPFRHLQGSTLIPSTDADSEFKGQWEDSFALLEAMQFMAGGPGSPDSLHSLSTHSLLITGFWPCGSPQRGRPCDAHWFSRASSVKFPQGLSEGILQSSAPPQKQSNLGNLLQVWRGHSIFAKYTRK